MGRVKNVLDESVSTPESSKSSSTENNDLSEIAESEPANSRGGSRSHSLS